MHTLPAEPSLFLQLGFIALPCLMILFASLVCRSWKLGAILAFWATVAGALGATGWLSAFSRTPPPIVFLLVATLIITGVLSLSRLGPTLASLTIRMLITFQAFRIAVEILIHQAVLEGIAPPQMSWEGLNLDILTGITAIGFGFFADKIPHWILHLWNAAGLFLVSWVVGVAILSMPSPIQQLRPDNVWVAFFPFVWLPTILVGFAIGGHILLFRKLLEEARTPATHSSNRNELMNSN